MLYFLYLYMRRYYMRDVSRIDFILKSVGDIWKNYPDLRLGQLLLNAVRDPMLYYVEDDKLVEELVKLYGSVDA